MLRKFAVAASVALSACLVGTLSAESVVGKKAPAIDGVVDSVTGKETSLKNLQGKKATVVAFTCNGCPVAIAYQDRFIEFAKSYQDKGVSFVAVNCNAGSTTEEMKERAEELQLPFPYVLDADSSSAKEYGATRTPELYVIDGAGQVVYHGAFDDDMSEPKTHYVAAAVDSVLAGKPVEKSETSPSGCGIKFAK